MSPIILSDEDRKILIQAVKLMFPDLDATMDDSDVIRVRKLNEDYYHKNFDVYWVNFIYRMFFPFIIAGGHTTTTAVKRDYSYHEVSIKMLMNAIQRFTQYIQR